jgi:putative transposase
MEKGIVKRKEFVLIKKKKGLTGYKIHKEFGYPKSSVYDWINKYENSNIDISESSPTRVKMAVDPKTRKYVIRLRNKWNWGPVRIEKFIRLRKPKGVKPIGHNKIYQIFVEEGLNLPIDFVRKTWGTKSFQRPYPNYLWQTDFKLLDNDNWSCTFLDDHSRFLPAGKEFDESPTTEIALEVFMIAGKKFGFPKQVLTDQGVQFYNTPVKGWKQEDSRFSKELKELGVQHIVASKRRPTTIGKIESFHRALKYEGRMLKMSYRKFFNYWNRQRPHQSLGYRYPKDIYLGGAK